MKMSNVAAWLGGSACLLYLINWILTSLRRKNIQDKVVLITGANSGLGRSCAHIFYKSGCRLVLAGRSLDKLKQVATELDKDNNICERVKVLRLDLEDLASIPASVSEALQMFGQVDILINNAGISYRGQAEDTSIDVHHRVMKVNYLGQVALTNELLPSMLESGGGQIVAVSSVQGRFAIPYRSAYAASKHALQAYFDSLRAEVADRNVHVCVISPGYIQTNLSVNALCGDGTSYGRLDKTTATGMHPDHVARVIRNAVELKASEVLLTPLLHKLVLFIRVLVPNLYFYIMRKRANKQKKDYVKTS